MEVNKLYRFRLGQSDGASQDSRQPGANAAKLVSSPLLLRLNRLDRLSLTV